MEKTVSSFLIFGGGGETLLNVANWNTWKVTLGQILLR